MSAETPISRGEKGMGEVVLAAGNGIQDGEYEGASGTGQVIVEFPVGLRARVQSPA